MFQLEQHDAQFANLNTRIQKHGADRVLAADLAMTVNAPNTILETIEPGLRTSLFRKPGKGDQMDFDRHLIPRAARLPCSADHPAPAGQCRDPHQRSGWRPL